jgi:diacylglycerol O-acyltransferase
MGRLKSSHMAEAGAWIVDLSELAPPMVMGALTRLVARAMHRVPQRMMATVTTNVPGPREPLYCLGRRMLEWRPYVPISQGLRVGTAILSYDGTLSFGITGDGDTVSDAGVLARAIEDEIRALRSSAAA